MQIVLLVEAPVSAARMLTCAIGASVPAGKTSTMCIERWSRYDPSLPDQFIIDALQHAKPAF